MQFDESERANSSWKITCKLKRRKLNKKNGTNYYEQEKKSENLMQKKITSNSKERFMKWKRTREKKTHTHKNKINNQIATLKKWIADKSEKMVENDYYIDIYHVREFKWSDTQKKQLVSAEIEIHTIFFHSHSHSHLRSLPPSLSCSLAAVLWVWELESEWEKERAKSQEPFTKNETYTYSGYYYIFYPRTNEYSRDLQTNWTNTKKNLTQTTHSRVFTLYRMHETA